MDRLIKTLLIAIVSATMSFAVTGCKRTDNGNAGSLNVGSSGVMSNSAAANGTPGESDAAKRVDSAAGAGASAVSAASSEPPVVSTPSSAASTAKQ
ncbi:hypothetical protein [Paraburkholderia sp. BCC1884]|uniref:hypothetical protein n=1 Tax=Paraburkholderia sp. BCC1884 TaxID=2562668 RepID=UPI0011825DF1|nr:hypothetical protein [Paraburkholderia sp. BCC1884]